MAFLLRLSPDLHARAVAQAAELGLSLNRFIALAVEEHFRRCGDRPILSVDAGEVPAVAAVPAAVPAAAAKPVPAKVAPAKVAPAVAPRRPKKRRRR